MNLQEFLEQLDTEDVKNLEWRINHIGTIRGLVDGHEVCPLEAVDYCRSGFRRMYQSSADYLGISRKDKYYIVDASDSDSDLNLKHKWLQPALFSTPKRLRKKMLEILRPVSNP